MVRDKLVRKEGGVLNSGVGSELHLGDAKVKRLLLM